MPSSKYLDAPCGKTFNRWTVLGYSHSRPGTNDTIHFWTCRCSCGSVVATQAKMVVFGFSKSCGCLQRETVKAGAKHGMWQSTEYSTWHGMKSRCNNSNDDAYPNYGGRGIKVCERWMGFSNFFADMGLRPSSKHSLERKDNSGNYEPSNCVWATKKEQQSNTRRTIRITWQGQTLCAKDWAKILGISYASFQHRYHRGWTIERIFTTPRIPKRSVLALEQESQPAAPVQNVPTV